LPSPEAPAEASFLCSLLSFPSLSSLFLSLSPRESLLMFTSGWTPSQGLWSALLPSFGALELYSSRPTYYWQSCKWLQMAGGQRAGRGGPGGRRGFSQPNPASPLPRSPASRRCGVGLGRVFMELGFYFVSARTNKRLHHSLAELSSSKSAVASVRACPAKPRDMIKDLVMMIILFIPVPSLAETGRNPRYRC